MMCYKDMTFCPFHEDCAHNKTCSRPLTDEVKAAAVAWWGSSNAPIAQYREKPECWEKNEEGES